MRIGSAVITENIIERLLTKSDIEQSGGDGRGLNQSIEDLLAFAIAIDNQLATTAEALWSVRWTASGKPGMLMTVTRFYEATDADAALDQIERGTAYRSMESTIGERSTLAPANADVGAAITFVRDRAMVSLQLPLASDGSTLLNEQQLLSLAITIEARL